MDHTLDTAKHALISSLSSSSIITTLDSTTHNSSIQHQHHNGSFISLRCRPILTALPPELLSKISCNLSLCDYSFLSRTCSRLHSHLFHPAELVLFLKTRYRLSIQSGSIIIFAYLANMQFKAPLLLERIFEDFFADSPLRLQEEQKWKLHCQQQRQQLNNNTYQLNQAILSKVNSGSNSNSENGTSLEYQRMDGIEVHKAAEKARRQAKSDAVRMLGVLYALDKTHIGPSSSTNALVLSGACDPPESASPAPVPTPSRVTETESATATETTRTLSSLPAFASPSSFSAIAPAPIRHASSFSSFSSYSTPSMTTTITTTTAIATTAETDMDETAVFLSASGLPSSSPRLRNEQGSPGRSHTQEGGGQQDRETVPRSRSTSLEYFDLAPQHHQHQYRQQHQATTHTRNVRKRPSPSIPSKDGKMSSSSSSSWWESPLTQQHAHSESSRFSPTRALSPTSTRHHLYHHYHHQRQRSPPSFSPSASSTSLTSVFSSVVPGSKVHQSGKGGGGSIMGGTASGGGASTATAAISGVAQPGSPSRTTTPPTPFSSTSSSSFSSSSTSSLPSSSATSFAVQDEARQIFFDHRNKRHMNLRAMMKERALLGDREAMEYVEYSHELAHRGCWPVDLDQDIDMDTSYYHHHQRTYGERGSERGYYTNAEVAAAFATNEMSDLPMDVDGGVDTDEWMHCDSTTPIPTTAKSFSSSSSSSNVPVASVVSPQQQANNENNILCSSSFKEPQLPTVSSSSSIAGCPSQSSSFANWSVLCEREKDKENESAFEATPLGISVPLIEANTSSSGGTGRWNGSGNGSDKNGGNGGSLSSCRMGVTSELSSSSLFSQGVSFRRPRGGNDQQQQSKSPLPRVILPTNTTFSSTSTTAPTSTSTTTTTMTTSTTTTSGAQQKMQQILNRNDKIAFLTKYTDRMHLKLQALGIEDWGQGDIQRKKTYQLMIQHNDKTGEKDLVKFYLGRYGGSVTTTSGSGEAGAGVQEPMGPLGLTSPLSVQQQQGQEQQGTPLVVQA